MIRALAASLVLAVAGGGVADARPAAVPVTLRIVSFPKVSARVRWPTASPKSAALQSVSGT